MLGTLLIAASLIGCASLPDKQIGKTSRAISGVEATFRGAYLSLNENRRAALIRTKVYRGQKIPNPSPVMDGSIYSDAGIEARIAALDTVARYAELLEAYGNGGQAKDVGDAASGFVGATFALQARVSGSGSDLAGPVSKLFGLVSEWATDAYLKKEFKKNLGPATDQVVAVLDLLKTDAENLIQTSAAIDASQEFSALLNRYNDAPEKLTLAERQQMAEMLIGAAAARDAARNPQLVDTVVAAKKAVIALNKRVQSGNDPADIKAATAAVEEFNSRVRALSETLEALKAARKG